jgi:alpha-beta hydrolase superfamily lysophospholipase
MKRALALLVSTLLAGCAASFQPRGPEVVPPRLGIDDLITGDGAVLAVRSWLPHDDPPWAAMIALHGMNDYSNAFDDAGLAWAIRGIAVYAPDLRGFGRSPNPGIWAGWQSMTMDVEDMIAAVKRRHPGLPVYLLGESMGGALAMTTAAALPPTAINGLILSAPAVWNRDHMGWGSRAALWLAWTMAPGWTLTGSSLHIQPSDNIPMLIKLSEDPLVIKGTRVDAIHGLVDLMDQAADQAPRINFPALILYGQNDQIIPEDAVMDAIRTMPGLGKNQKLVLYPKGWHMLMRDLQAPTVWDDVADWMKDPTLALRSETDETPEERQTLGRNDNQ